MSSTASTVKTPSTVRTVVAPSGLEAEHDVRGGRRQRDAPPLREPARRGRDDELTGEHRSEGRAEPRNVARRDPPRRQPAAMSRARNSSPRMPLATARLAPVSASAARYAETVPTESHAHDPLLERERIRRRDTGALPLDGADDERGERELAVLRHLRQRGDARRRQRCRSVDATRPGRQAQLSGLQVRVELAAEDRRRVTQARVASPQPHARGERLVGVVRSRIALRPAPRPQVRQLELARDLADGERLPLRDVEPARAGLQPLAATRPRPRLEPDHDPDARGRDADREQLRRRLPVAHPEPARAVDRPVPPDEVRVRVVLEHEIGHRADRPPPRRGVAAGERLARHEERRPCHRARRGG